MFRIFWDVCALFAQKIFAHFLKSYKLAYSPYNQCWGLVCRKPWLKTTLVVQTERFTELHSYILAKNFVKEFLHFLSKNKTNILGFFRTHTLHKKWSFPLRISSVIVTKSLLENFIFCGVTAGKETRETFQNHQILK